MSNKEDPYDDWRQIRTDSVRLLYQHFMWREHFRWIIHPSIDLRGRNNVRVAELAAAHCLWAIEAAETLGPSAHIEGSDISLDIAPSPALLPPNVSLRKWSIFDDIPPGWEGSFDLVHVRLIVGAFGHRHPEVVLRKFVSLLKPGGYLQWDEYKYAPESKCNSLTLSTDPSRSQEELFGMFPASAELAQNVLQGFKWHTDWFGHLPDHFESHGLTDVLLEEQLVQPSLARAFHELWIAFYPQMIEVFQKIDPPRAERMEKLLMQVVREQKEYGLLVSRMPSVVVGRKPLLEVAYDARFSR